MVDLRPCHIPLFCCCLFEDLTIRFIMSDEGKWKWLIDNEEDGRKVCERLFSLFVAVVVQPFNGRLINPAYWWNKTTLSQLQHLQKKIFFCQKWTKSDKSGHNWKQPCNHPSCFAVEQQNHCHCSATSAETKNSTFFWHKEGKLAKIRQNFTQVQKWTHPSCLHRWNKTTIVGALQHL